MNWFDIAVIGVVGLSALLALFRGFIKEMLSLIGWVAAAVITAVVLQRFRGEVQEFGSRFGLAEPLPFWIAGVLIFLVVLVVWALLSGIITRGLRGGALGLIDAILGLAFGLARGALLVSIAYLLLLLAWPREDIMPEWVKTAQTRPYLKMGADYIQRFSPEEWVKSAQDAIRRIGGGEPAPPPAPVPPPSPPLRP